MFRHRRCAIVVTLLAALIAVSLAGCAAMPFGKPPGNRIGSCEGRMRLASGRRTSFRVDLFASNGDGQLYLTMPGMYRYSPIEDFDFSGNHIEIELASEQIVRGVLAGDKLTFSGNIGELSGSVMLDLDN